ncbi:MAG: DUF1232 domain-containing protein [Anaerolineales bacterium]|nr:DUF1232 domain-containing protein [Anaerolineales bacterium]
MSDKPSEEFAPSKYDGIIKEGAQNVTEKDVEKVINKSEEIQSKFSARGPLARFIEDGKLLIAIVKDYWAGAYRQVPYGAIASMVFTLIYVLNPFDIMPDVLPIIGQLDDVAVMGACLILVEQDLHKYKDWKEGQE